MLKHGPDTWACTCAYKISQFLHSYWSRATAETVVPHHAIRVTRTAFPYKELFTRGPYHFVAGGYCVERNHWKINNFCIYFTFWPKSVDVFLTEKVFMNGNQSVLNRFSTSGLNPPRPGSFILLFDQKVLMFFWPKRYLWMGIKVCWIGFQLVV